MEKIAQKIKITVMNRTGHEDVEVDFDGAVDMMKAELSKGKWLNVKTNDGKNYIITQLEVFTKDLDKITADILNAKKLILMSELKGGGCNCKDGNSSNFVYDSEGYDRQGYGASGYDRDGFNAEGFDNIGYDREGYDAQGYDDEGYDLEGYNRDGLTVDGESRLGTKSTIAIKVVKDPESASIIVVTDKEVVFNNAHGKEAFAAAVARLFLAVNETVPDLMSGKAVVATKG